MSASASITVELNHLSNAAVRAEQDFESAYRKVQHLRTELERQGPAMSTADFVALNAQLEQAELKLGVASKVRGEAQTALAKVRSVEEKKMLREITEREYSRLTQELGACHVGIKEREKRIQTLQAEIQSEGQRHSILLQQLAALKRQLAN